MRRGTLRAVVSNALNHNLVTHLVKHQAGRVVNLREHLSPSWVRCPECIQIDTHNYCNLACEYCNVKVKGSFEIPRGKMPTEMLKYIIRYWGRFPEMQTVAPYVNGEPLLDNRLYDLFSYAAAYAPHASCVLDTNGTVYRGRRMLAHPNLREIRFSLSAATRKTYERVHGVDRFGDVMRTVEWIEANKYPGQDVQFHFMVNRHNEHEVEEYAEMFRGRFRKFFPLHRMPGIQRDSDKAVKGVSKRWAGVWEPLFIYPSGYRQIHTIPKYQTCQGMAFAVMWDGTILHCTDAPPIYNYGHVYKVDMLESWHMRNRARLTNPACLACSVKRRDWQEVLRKHVPSCSTPRSPPLRA